MGYQIKEMREKRGITQEELADKSGVSRATIALLETKKDYITTTKTLISIAKALNVAVSDIFYANDV